MNTSLPACNLSRVQPGAFASVQWYQKDPALFRAEQVAMHRSFPQAKLGYLKDGRAYWMLPFTVKLGAYSKKCVIMLVYDSDHPSNAHYGGSVKAFLVTPTISELQARASAAGRGGIPHLLSEGGTPYLCIARQKDVENGRERVTSAVTSAAWAIKWMYCYEGGLRDARLWSRFCRHVV